MSIEIMQVSSRFYRQRETNCERTMSNESIMKKKKKEQQYLVNFIFILRLILLSTCQRMILLIM